MSEIPVGMRGKRREFRSLGLCQDCGGPLDQPETFVRCKDCRETRSQYIRAYNALQKEISREHAIAVSTAMRKHLRNRDAEIAIEQEKLKLRIQKCKKCEWAKIEDTIIFCPFMDGICQKGVYRRGNQNQG